MIARKFFIVRTFHLFCALLLLSAPAVFAATIVEPAQPITQRVTVQIVQVAASDGSNAAPLFGSAAAQGAIFGSIDTIWAQAGVDVDFKMRLDVWNNSFALTGNSGTIPRPQADLTTIAASALAAGITDPNPLVINLFMVRVVPGFSQRSNNNSNGLAFIDANGIMLWAGPSLTTFADGQDVIAAVLAHEIGHNLGLSHMNLDFNLMDAGANEHGQRLTAAQIAIALASPFSVPIPEPGSLLLLLVGAGSLFHRMGTRAERRSGALRGH